MAGCRAWLVVTRDTRTHAIAGASFARRGGAHERAAIPRPAAAPPCDRRPGRPRAPLRSASTAGLSRALPAIRSPPRSSPTASGWSAAPSNITARAASSPPAPEEPNALVELRTGARREPNTKATTVELYDGLEARARTAGRRCAST